MLESHKLTTASGVVSGHLAQVGMVLDCSKCQYSLLSRSIHVCILAIAHLADSGEWFQLKTRIAQNEVRIGGRRW